MIVVSGTPPQAGTIARVLAALRGRGHEVAIAPEPSAVDREAAVLLVTDAVAGVDDWIAYAVKRVGRILVASRLGAHRDARAAALLRLWRLEEAARATGLPTLTLRLGPVLGPETQLARKLVSRPALPKAGRWLLNPVWEEDVLETFDRSLKESAAWEGWCEVAGDEVWSLAELASAAVALGAEPGGAWEPPLEEMAEHRLAEASPWLERFGLETVPLSARLEALAATRGVGA